jgi:hypothetical protein
MENLLKPEHWEFPSNTEACLPLPPCPDYDIEEDETIEVWVPAEALEKSDKPIRAGQYTIYADTYEQRIDHAIQGLKEEQSGLDSDMRVATFLLTFFTCEIVAKSIIGRSENEGTNRKSLPERYKAKEVTCALKERKIDFDQGAVEKLFSSAKVGASEMSARMLRNQIAHRMKPQYRKAVRERYESLMGTMGEFLSAVEAWRKQSSGRETQGGGCHQTENARS